MAAKGRTFFEVKHSAVGPVYAMWAQGDQVSLDDLRAWYVAIGLPDKKAQDAEIERLVAAGAFEEKPYMEGQVLAPVEPVALAPKPDFRRPEEIA